MQSPEIGSSPEQNKLAEEIQQRASAASEKIQKRAGQFIQNLDQWNKLSDQNEAKMWLLRLQNDFFTLVKNPDDECGGGNYKGWTADEIKELYSVLYGEEMED